MAKNRKHQSAVVRFGPALKAFVLCVLIGGSGVGYVWQKSQIDQLSIQIKKREHKLAALDNQNKNLRDQLAKLRSPAQLKERVQKLNLGLGMPQPNQVWPLPEPVVAPPAVEATIQTLAAAPAAGFAMH